jgi:hypothetical protein
LDLLIGEQTRLSNQLTDCLKSYFPWSLTCFDKVAQKTTLAFLQAFPSREQARGASVEAFTQVLQAQHYPKAAQKAAHLWADLQGPQLQAPPPLVQAKTRLMLALVAQLTLVMEQVAGYDAAIAEGFAQHADAAVFSSLPGAGRRLAPKLLAEWGDDRLRYADASQVQALSGTAPVLWQSGKLCHARRRKACVHTLGQALFLFAEESRLFEDWPKVYYERKRREGKTHAMAVRALAHQWVRILYAMWVKHEPYQRDSFQAAQQAHGRSAVSTAWSLTSMAPDSAQPTPLGSNPTPRAARSPSRPRAAARACRV